MLWKDSKVIYKLPYGCTRVDSILSFFTETDCLGFHLIIILFYFDASRLEMGYKTAWPTLKRLMR